MTTPFALRPSTPTPEMLSAYRIDAERVLAAAGYAPLGSMERSALDKRTAEAVHPLPPKSQNGVGR